MSFLDQVRGGAGGGGSQVPPDNNPQGGYMGMATRPRQRYLDKVLMKQRDRKQGEMEAASMMAGGMNPGMGPNPTGQPIPSPFGSLFGGGSR